MTLAICRHWSQGPDWWEGQARESKTLLIADWRLTQEG